MIYLLLILAVLLAILDAKDLKNPDKKIRSWAIVKLVIIIMAAGLQKYHDSSKDEEAVKILAHRDSTYAAKIDKAQKDNSAQIQTTAYEMTRIFAEGVKKGEKNTKQIITNTDINSKRLGVKLDSNKLKPPYVELFRQPRNAFKVTVHGVDISVECWVENSGDNIAYALYYDSYIVFKTPLGLFKRSLDVEKVTPKNLSGDTRRRLTVNINGAAYIYNNSKKIYCIVMGYYYTDEALKNKKEFKAGTVILKDTDEIGNYQEPIPIEEFLKSASLI